jgi:signal transduction histidine kinase
LAGKTEQGVLSLLSNASKFSPDKGTITFRALIIDNVLVIDISDNGTGISREEQERLFQPG